jgi:hypothetical protein
MNRCRRRNIHFHSCCEPLSRMPHSGTTLNESGPENIAHEKERLSLSQAVDGEGGVGDDVGGALADEVGVSQRCPIWPPSPYVSEISPSRIDIRLVAWFRGFQHSTRSQLKNPPCLETLFLCGSQPLKIRLPKSMPRSSKKELF